MRLGTWLIMVISYPIGPWFLHPTSLDQSPTEQVRLELGAKLGAILCGSLRTAVDAGGLKRPSFRPVWTPTDARGHGLEIYGSEGWEFESLRAC
ncbi:MAG: hypothetical protein KJP22_12810, partial [Acidimicrobiia bacterium]|nr:hypothetical protein [Acidimicrobiia bacterium]